MAQLIFATGNAGKMREIREILRDLPLEVKSMKEAGINVDVVEDGTTFEENALIKARAIHAVSGGIVLADDSGLVVDYMDGMPGIYSARFMGEETSYDIKNQAIIDALKEAEGEERSARFVCAIAAVLPADGGDYQVLYEKDADAVGRPMSISKVLTAICVLDILQDLQEKLTYHQLDTNIGPFYVKDFAPGDTLTYLDALHAMMLESSNVTAQALARSAGHKL